MVSELDDGLKSGYHESPLGYDNVDWFVDEVKKLEKNVAFQFENTNKDFLMSEKEEEHCRKNNSCQFCEKFIESDKVRDQCHPTVKYTGPVHNNCNINVTEK